MGGRALLLLALVICACAQLPTSLTWGRSGLAASSTSTVAVFAGGSLNASSFSRSAEIFDLAALNSTILPNALCIPRHQLAAGTAGTKIIFAGGADQSGYLGNIDTYDSASGSWTCTGSLSVARSLLTAGYAGQVALFAGGSSSSNAFEATVDQYDDATGLWTVVAPLSVGRHSLAAASWDSTIMVAGGLTADGPVNTVDIYDATARAWVTATIMARIAPNMQRVLSEPRYGLAAASAGGKLFFAGGRNAAGEASAVVDVFELALSMWCVVRLSEARYNLAAAGVGPVAVFAGGQNGTSEFSAMVDAFDSTTEAHGRVASLPVPAALLAGVAGRDKLLFGGGENAAGRVNQLASFDANGYFFVVPTCAGQPVPAPGAVCTGCSCVLDASSAAPMSNITLGPGQILSVNGSLSMATAAAISIALTPGVVPPFLIVEGTATVQGSLTLTADEQSGFMPDAACVRILSATGSISGELTSVTIRTAARVKCRHLTGHGAAGLGDVFAISLAQAKTDCSQLSTAAIAGIAIGACALLVIGVIVVIVVLQKKGLLSRMNPICASKEHEEEYMVS